MTTSTVETLPRHLQKYVVEQNYERYTPEDQAVWRFIMRQLKSFLSEHAHSSYAEGLTKTGIRIDRIPQISEIDEHLQHFGWGAVPVSGFIPPAAFMEFQSLGVLPIASDMRTLDHLLYTPAPDIVHEAAGHAPILIHPEFAEYLRKYAEVASHSILSKEDLEQYEAIRILSDLKEDPASTASQISQAEERLNVINNSLRYTSEAGLLSRMNWWTAEYGLIGDLKNPKIFGAGLLSSVGESRECLGPKVKKLPLTIDCIHYSYDITEPQPQLFVTPDFETLHDVLEQLAVRLSFRVGGMKGLEQALLSQTTTTIQLNSGIQISGQLESYKRDGSFLKFAGPCQLALERQEISGQGVGRHSQGYSTPVGLLHNETRCLSTYSPNELTAKGLVIGRAVKLEYQSGIVVNGTLTNIFHQGSKLVMLTFSHCQVSDGDQILFDPSWGEYDLAVGSSIPSVFGGPADRERFGETDDFVAKRVPAKIYSEVLHKDFQFFEETRALRGIKSPTAQDQARYLSIVRAFLSEAHPKWLKGIELLELGNRFGIDQMSRDAITQKIDPHNYSAESIRLSIQDGIRLSQFEV